MLGLLKVVAGPDQDSSFPIEEGEPVVIGRGQDTTTRLKDPQVSRKHCQLVVEGKKAILVDSGSTAGTMVNGKKISRHELQPGDSIQIGGTRMVFLASGTADATTLVVGKTQPVRPSGQSAGQLADLVGKTLAHFQIESVLAPGRSGMVFKAADTKEQRQVALKVLWPEFSRNEEEMQRFIRAMKTMLPLRHPNLVALYSAGRTGDFCWIAMEFVDGESLTEVIERIGTAGMLDWRNALRVALHVGRALEYAEEHQIIHRNIQPTNILVQHSDKLSKLGDLMLAKALEGTMAEQITRQGQLVGEIVYMSPERTRGGAAVVDCRSDIYSLGATVYALLTGRPPFDAGSLPETIRDIRTAEPVLPKKFQLAIPDQFQGTVLKMLAKRPEERFQSAAELLADLERVAKYQGITL